MSDQLMRRWIVMMRDGRAEKERKREGEREELDEVLNES